MRDVTIVSPQQVAFGSQKLLMTTHCAGGVVILILHIRWCSRYTHADNGKVATVLETRWHHGSAKWLMHFEVQSCNCMFLSFTADACLLTDHVRLILECQRKCRLDLAKEISFPVADGIILTGTKISFPFRDTFRR